MICSPLLHYTTAASESWLQIKPAHLTVCTVSVKSTFEWFCALLNFACGLHLNIITLVSLSYELRRSAFFLGTYFNCETAVQVN